MVASFRMPPGWADMQLTSLRRRRHTPFIILLLGLVVVVGCRPAAVPNGVNRDRVDLDRLLHLIERRLAIMHDVARWKWTSGQTIADPRRERESLDKVVGRGREKGLDPDLVRRFFAA